MDQEAFRIQTNSMNLRFPNHQTKDRAAIKVLKVLITAHFMPVRNYFFMTSWNAPRTSLLRSFSIIGKTTFAFSRNFANCSGESSEI